MRSDCLPSIIALMDDMTTMTLTAPCTTRLLDKLNNNLQWARMEIKPSKSRSLSIVMEKVIDKRFVGYGVHSPPPRTTTLVWWRCLGDP